MNIMKKEKMDSYLLKLPTLLPGIKPASSTAIVFTRYILLEWLRRKASDPKTICELFYVCCDDICCNGCFSGESNNKSVILECNAVIT